ncbi:hypothetical protein PsorP6_012304 [Peronosclerospora sorghi]|uniref:Uncharacterized protein n=1 Tax=Peronosclerospora sorghi TaxID=230839 RepID=A0ACC0WFK8_9STRA|nr:hypothetical protein PsorP6_012304 [Peronosclerospora sorghi]
MYKYYCSSASRCTRIRLGIAISIPRCRYTKRKIEVQRVEFNHLSETDIQSEDKVFAAFSCLGTTRKYSGSAKAFRKGREDRGYAFVRLDNMCVVGAVDLQYVLKFEELCRMAGVPYFGLLTSQGANKDSWFLYPQTKGEVEENVQQLGFQRTSIFRPGMLKRRDLQRNTETLLGWMMPGFSDCVGARNSSSRFETWRKAWCLTMRATGENYKSGVTLI